jgi:hypothetical protein
MRTKHLHLAAILALALFAGIATAAAAQTLPAGITAVPLAVITNDRDTSVSQIKLMVNGNSKVRGIYLVTSKNASAPPSSSEVYWLKNIETDDGVVLGKGKGHKAILMRGDIASQAGRGSLIIRYLKNGLFRHYKQCRINLKKVGPYQWQLINAYDGQPVDHIKVETWALGISTLANVCPDSRA